MLLQGGWVYQQQTLSFSQLYRYGVRGFMLDVYYDEQEEELLLCHGGCRATFIAQKVGPPDTLASWLAQIRHTLAAQPQEIITLQLESYVIASEIYELLDTTGLKPYLLTSKKPIDLSLTLGEMRANNERLVIFSDYAKERQISTDFAYAPAIYPSKYYKETHYSLRDYKKCEMRTDFRADPLDSSISLFVFNHFYRTSYEAASKAYDDINSYTTIMLRAKLCMEKGLFPNFITVDFVERGDFGGAKSVVETLMSMQNYSALLAAPFQPTSIIYVDKSFSIAHWIHRNSIATVIEVAHIGYFYREQPHYHHGISQYLAIGFSPALTLISYILSDLIPHTASTTLIAATSSFASFAGYQLLGKMKVE